MTQTAFETKPGARVTAVWWPGVWGESMKTDPEVLRHARALVRGQVPNRIDERGPTGLRVQLVDRGPYSSENEDGFVDVEPGSWIVVTPEDGTVILPAAAFLALFVPVPPVPWGPEQMAAFREGFADGVEGVMPRVDQAITEALDRGALGAWGRLGGDGPEGG